jgi:hypothetical protein
MFFIDARSVSHVIFSATLLLLLFLFLQFLSTPTTVATASPIIIPDLLREQPQRLPGLQLPKRILQFQ